MSRRVVLEVLLVATVLLPVGDVGAQCSLPNPAFSGTGSVGTISVSPSGGMPASWGTGLEDGMDQWNQGCNAGITGPIPELTLNGSSPVTVNVQFYPGKNPGGECGTSCGCTEYFVNSSGALTSATIMAYERRSDGSYCGVGAESFFAHELGHVFGLDNSTCGIMGPNPYESTVSPTDCQTADGMWQTPMEGEGKIDPDAPCSDPCPDPNSPLVIDMAGNGIHASGVHYPVSFDVDGDGAADLIGWTTPGTDDAFLWLDLNDNGTVEDGRELFGTATVLPDGSRASHGFEALGVFDLVEFGGDGDGVITPDDAIWHDLRLWNDFNRDAVSQKEEVRKLNQSKLVALGLEFVESDWVDGALTGHFFQGACVLRRKGARGWSTEVGDVHDLFFPRVLPP